MSETLVVFRCEAVGIISEGEIDRGKTSERPHWLYFDEELDDEMQMLIEDHNRHVR